MKVVILGCGRFGSAVAEMLIDNNCKVVAIDANESIIDSINNKLDVLAICGNGASYEVLDEAGMKDTDVFIACTASDETNVMASCYARNMGAKHTIARFREQGPGSMEYNFIKDQLRLDMIVSPDYITAKDSFDFLRFKKVNQVIIVGGTRITVFLATMLANAGIKVKVIDKDDSRCKYVRRNVPASVIIINEKGPIYDNLLREGIEEVDGFVAATVTDAENILSSLFAVEHKVPVIVTKVDKDSYSDIVNNLDLQYVISPRMATAKLIIDYVKDCK